MKALIALFVIASSALLTGCADRQQNTYLIAYEQAMQRFPGSTPAGTEIADQFVALFTNLKGPDLTSQIDAVYAKTLFFSDTLHVLTEREALRDYLIETAERVEKIDVQIKHVFIDGNDVWLNWRMQTRAKALGKTMRASTMGMSHLRFDSEGKVVLHQDYWDSTEGVMVHIPIIGGLVRWTRNRL
jgi:ketosteroid isomerase-like protein